MPAPEEAFELRQYASMIADILFRRGGMVMLDRIVPTLVRLMKVEKIPAA